MRQRINCLIDIFEANITKLAQYSAMELTCAANNDKTLLDDMITTSKLSLMLLGKLNSLAHGNQHDLIVGKLKERMKAYEDQLINFSERKEGYIELKQNEVLTNFLNVGDNDTKDLGTVSVVEQENNIIVYQSQLLLRQCTIKNKRMYVYQEQGD